MLEFRIRTGLHVLPEVDIGMVEDVGVQVEVVEALRAEDHADVVARVEQRQRLQVEARRRHLPAALTLGISRCGRYRGGMRIGLG